MTGRPKYSVAYLGFHFGGGGGGVQNIFVKVGVFAWREKWCNLVRFGEYFAKIS